MLRRDAADNFLALADLMTLLRSETGCAWDRTQTLQTLRSYLLEETHEVLEVLDALNEDGGGPRVPEHRDELGDLMLQIVFQAEIQREAGRFDVGDVCEAIRTKLVRRHPELFGAGQRIGAPGSQEGWEAQKRKERGPRKSALDGVPKHLPALLRAYRTGEKAHGAGFDWPDHKGVVEKIEEELAEVKQAIDGGDKQQVAGEIGDLLYAIVNLSRHFEIDPEAALRGTMGRFERRFRLVEESLAKEGKQPEGQPLDDLERRWQEAKRRLSGEEP